MQLNDYLNQLENLQNVHPVLIEMERYGKSLNFPILNRLSARLVSIISLMNKAEYVFEIGSGFGYSAMWISIYNDYLKEIHLTDYMFQNLEMATEFFRIAGLENKLRTHLGDGISILESMNMEFDLILNDAEKTQYLRVLEVVKKKLKVGGIFISDNALWHQKVLKEDENDKETLTIREFNRKIFSDKSFISSLVPIGDGIIVSIKVM
ncbi:MAG: class I SAM-dependent methyltransferase [candidate division WOR-3 bacterium]|nr:class I SAM-dependent methyltransferase [candidate division WOR-3 bacterium]MCX7947694.1 class I SAM-dependent methyltransferase [candidate division WOR-3 bacterium]MDW8150571.1 class I SAM-dependent methyltransferase [candidate division WOR-3 bacterium]